MERLLRNVTVARQGEMRLQKSMRLSSGFSLIEVIVILLLVGIFTAMIVPFFQSGVYDSASLLQTRTKLYDLNIVLSRMIVDYEETYTKDLSGLSDAIGSVGVQNNAYGEYSVVSKVFWNIGGGTNNGLQVTVATPDGLSSMSYLFTQK